ncbi:MAG: hypothetical protein RLN69_15225, partial [Woeseiaceae bacterium]
NLRQGGNGHFRPKRAEVKASFLLQVLIQTRPAPTMLPRISVIVHNAPMVKPGDRDFNLSGTRCGK